MTSLPWTYDDGGRQAAGYKGETGDCVTRAVAIATGIGYQEVYDAINDAARQEKPRKGRTRSSARTGVAKSTSRRFLTDLGWVWTPTMTIGSGCKVHLAKGELPDDDRLIVAVSKHYCAVIDGVIHDTHDPSRDGTRCVYGYWRKPLDDAFERLNKQEHCPEHEWDEPWRTVASVNSNHPERWSVRCRHCGVYVSRPTKQELKDALPQYPRGRLAQATFDS